MAHIIFAVYASEKKHQVLQDTIHHKLKYKIEGKDREGYHQPFLSEIKLYDVRIKKECIPQFLRDMNIDPIKPTKKPKGRWYSGHFSLLLHWPIKIFRRTFRLKGIKEDINSLQPTIILDGHHNAWMIGIMDDMITDENEEVL